MNLNFLSVFFLAVVISTFLLVFAPMVDHIFYIDHKLDESTDLEIFMTILVHIILLGILIYLFHLFPNTIQLECQLLDFISLVVSF